MYFNYYYGFKVSMGDIVYTVARQIDIYEPDYVLASFTKLERIKCLSQCNLNYNCYGLSFSQQTGACNLYTYFTNESLVNNSFSSVYYTNRPLPNLIALTTTSSTPTRGVVPAYLATKLTHYWPINNDLTDYVGTANLQPTLNVQMAPDRFGIANSSVYLNHGYMSIKPDVYFDSSDFTVMAWIKPLSVTSSSEYVFIECYQDQSEDNFYITYGSQSTNFHVMSVDSNDETFVYTTFYPTLNRWFHMAVVQKSARIYIYINATLLASDDNDNLPPHVVRDSCHFGHTDYSHINDAVAYFDDIQFYEGGLNITDIQNIFNS